MKTTALGRPATITADDMKEALDSLTADGRPIPSLRRLRQYLGRGSLTTIHKLRKQATERHQAETGEPIGPDPVRERLIAHFDAMLDIIWNETHKDAEYEINETRKGSDDLVTAAEARRDKVLHERHQLTKRVEAAESSETRTRSEFNTLMDEHTKALNRLEERNAQLANLSSNNATQTRELELALDQLSSLHQQTAELSTRLDEEKDGRLADKKADKVTAEHLKKALIDSDNLLLLRTAALDAAKQSREEREADFQEEKNANLRLHKQLDRANDDKDKLRSELAVLRVENGLLKDEIQASREALVEHRTTLTLINNNQENKDAEIRRLNELVSVYASRDHLPTRLPKSD